MSTASEDEAARWVGRIVALVVLAIAGGAVRNCVSEHQQAKCVTACMAAEALDTRAKCEWFCAQAHAVTGGFSMGETVPHIAVVLHVQGDDELTRQAALWTEACRLQLLNHVAPAWGWAPPPGVFFYGVADGIPSEAAAVVAIMRDARNPDAAGYHAAIGKMVLGAVDLSRSLNPSRTLSHEICEIYRNAYLDEWLPSPIPGRLYAAELCDPVQANDYQITAEVLGRREKVTVGDFLLPSWFGQASDARKTYCGSVRNAFEVAPGGYQIALEGDSILYLPARNEAVRAAAVNRPLSRSKLITEGVTIPHTEGVR